MRRRRLKLLDRGVRVVGDDLVVGRTVKGTTGVNQRPIQAGVDRLDARDGEGRARSDDEACLQSVDLDLRVLDPPRVQLVETTARRVRAGIPLGGRGRVVRLRALPD